MFSYPRRPVLDVVEATRLPHADVDGSVASSGKAGHVVDVGIAHGLTNIWGVDDLIVASVDAVVAAAIEEHHVAGLELVTGHGEPDVDLVPRGAGNVHSRLLLHARPIAPLGWHPAGSACA